MTTTNLAGLRARAELFDELVEQLARVESELEATRAADTEDWREIANLLAGALRPYTMFREQRLRDGKIVVESAVPAATLTRACRALDALGRRVAVESYRRDGVPVADERSAAA